VKYFMTVGDWTAKIWFEDSKQPLITTKYDRSYLTSGCWSPTRPGVLFTTKLDGTLDVWDYYHKQNEPTFSTKVSDSGLASIKVQAAGKMVALGSLDGTVTVLQLSRGLVEQQKEEKSTVAAMFERELRREKNLELRYIQREKKIKDDAKKRAQGGNDGSQSPSMSSTQTLPATSVPTEEDDQATKDALQKAEVDFYLHIDMGNAGGAEAAGDQQEEETKADSKEDQE
jgi:dynein intermediate chain 2